MNWFSIYICSVYQTTWVWLIAWIIFDNFTIAYGIEYFFKIQSIILGFFICMIGNVVVLGIYSSDDVLDVHPCVSIYRVNNIDGQNLHKGESA